MLILLNLIARVLTLNIDKVLMKKIRSSLAPIEMASFYAGVRHKRYNEERDKWS
jgi:hypothetical protein